jgi:hypothetical protein
MSFNIPEDKEEKTVFLNMIKQHIILDIYKYCLLCGLDVDTFSYETFIDKKLPITEVNEYSLTLKNLCKKMSVIEKKLEEIND